MRTFKGGYDALVIRKKLKEFKQQLAEELLVNFAPYERFLATERLLLAEYMIQLSRLQAQGAGLTAEMELRERVNQQMKKAIEAAQVELAARTASKLDLAKLVANLRELSLAIDRDLAQFRKEIGTEQKKLASNIELLAHKIKEQTERIERHNQRTLELEKRTQSISDNVDGIMREFKVFTGSATRRGVFLWVFNILVAGLILFLIWR